MSSVPSEVLHDILLPLDRWTLDDAQFANRRFLRLTTARMSDVCLRQVRHASVGGLITHKGGGPDVYSDICFKDRPGRQIISNGQHEDAAYLFTQLIQALRSSRIDTLIIIGLELTPELATLVLQTPIAVHDLNFRDVSCTELTPAQFHEVILHFSPTNLDVSRCRLRACQLTDGFLRDVNKNSSRTTMQNGAPVEGGGFYLTDDTVVDFCVQEDVGIGGEGDMRSDFKPFEELILDNGRFTKDLFKRLVEASSASMRTQMLRIIVSPLPRIEDDDLRDFAEHLSFRKRDWYGYRRVYDFPDEPNGMHLQLRLDSDPEGLRHSRPGDSLIMVRARRPNSFFYEPHK